MKSITTVLFILLTSVAFGQITQDGTVQVYNAALGAVEEHTYRMSQEYKTYDNGDTTLATIYCVMNGSQLIFEFSVFRDISNDQTDVYFSQAGGERKSMCSESQKVKLKDTKGGKVSDPGLAKLGTSSVFGLTMDGDGFISIYEYTTANGTKFEFW